MRYAVAARSGGEYFFAEDEGATASEDEIKDEIASRLGITADDESFDLVLSITALEFIRDYQRAVAEIAPPQRPEHRLPHPAHHGVVGRFHQWIFGTAIGREGLKAPGAEAALREVFEETGGGRLGP